MKMSYTNHNHAERPRIRTYLLLVGIGAALLGAACGQPEADDDGASYDDTYQGEYGEDGDGSSSSTDCYGSCVDSCLSAGGSSCGADCSDLCSESSSGSGSGAGNTSSGGCDYTNDGVCDEPEGSDVCPEGTDVNDCAGSGGCDYTNDGQCDEPEGSGVCPEGTDVNDCATNQCISAGNDCSGAGDTCCSGTTCVDYGSYGIACGTLCNYGSDCQSGCCVPLQNGGSVCAPASFCG
jgi:hypothetical protein